MIIYVSTIPYITSLSYTNMIAMLVSSSSSLNLVKSKTAIPPEHILPKRSEGVKINDISGVFFYQDIFEAIMNRDHASILRIVDQDRRQLERCDFSHFDVPANSIPLLVAINFGLPIQLIKLLISNTPQRLIGRQNFAGASALSLAITRRMPQDVLSMLIARTPSEGFSAQGDFHDSILTLAVLSKVPLDVIAMIIDKTPAREMGSHLMLAINQHLPLPLFEEMVKKASIEDIRRTVVATMHKNNMSPEYMCRLAEADLPVASRGVKVGGYSSWHKLLAHPGDVNFEAIKLILQRNKDIVGQLAISEDADGRISFGMASKRVRDEISKYL